MKYISLDKIQNSYPLDKQKKPGIISQTYRTDTDQSIVNQGEFVTGDAKFPIPPSAPPLGDDVVRGSGIQAIAGTSFRFILEIDGVKYSSPEFINDLNSAAEESNPYFNINTVSTISFSSANITTPARNHTIGLKYAEATLNGGSDLINGDHASIIEYINNLVRPVLSTGGDTITNVNDMGSWKVKISNYNPKTDTGMGFEYTDLLEDEKNIGSSEVQQ